MRSRPLLATLLLTVSQAGAAPDPRFDGQKPDKPSAAAMTAPEAPAVPKTEPDEPRRWVVVDASDAKTRTAAATAGVSIEEVRPGQVAGFATPAAIARAQAAGLRILSSQPLSERFSRKDFPAKDSAYHNFAETVAELKAMAAKAPDIASLFSIGKTTQGRDLWALRLCADAKGPAASRKPGILFMGMHHAREHLSNEVPLLLAKRLIENRQDPEIARLLASRDVTVIPMVNPDGGEYDVSDDKYHMQRKNMRRNANGTVGVDLNRNYAWGWGGEGASADPGDDTYRGPSAFSEPETKAVKAFIEGKKNLTTLLSYHTFSELVLYPWGGSNEPISDKKALKAYQVMAEEMGRMTGYTPMQSSGLYVATGDLCDWSWGEHGIFSWTFEMTPKSMWNGGFYPGVPAIAASLQANWRPMLYLIDLADDPRRVAKAPGLTPREPILQPPLQPAPMRPETVPGTELGRVDLATQLDRNLQVTNLVFGARALDLGVATDAAFSKFFLTFSDAKNTVLAPIGNLNDLRGSGVDARVDAGTVYNFRVQVNVFNPARDSTLKMTPVSGGGPSHDMKTGAVLDAAKARATLFSAGAQEFWVFYGRQVDPATGSFSDARSFLFVHEAGLSSKAWPLAESALAVGSPAVVDLGGARVSLTRTAEGFLLVRAAP